MGIVGKNGICCIKHGGICHHEIELGSLGHTRASNFKLCCFSSFPNGMIPPKLIYLIFSAGQKTCKTSGRRTTYLTPGGPWLQRIVCQDRRRTGERSEGWTAGEAKGCDEIPGRGRTTSDHNAKDRNNIFTHRRAHTQTQMDRCMMVHMYPLVFVMSSFVHTFLCADVLAYIIYTCTRCQGRRRKSSAITHWHPASPKDVEEEYSYDSHDRRRKKRRGPWMTIPWRIPGSHGYHPTTTGESIKCVIPCNSHILPQSPARAPGRVSYDDEAPALVLVRYWIRYNSII